MSGPNIFPTFFLASPFLEAISADQRPSSFSEFRGRQWTNPISHTMESTQKAAQAGAVFRADSHPLPQTFNQAKKYGKYDLSERKEASPSFQEQSLEEPCPPSPPSQHANAGSDIEVSPSIQRRESIIEPLSPRQLALPEPQVQDPLDRVQEIFVEVDEILSQKRPSKIPNDPHISFHPASPPIPISPQHAHFRISPDLRSKELDEIAKSLDKQQDYEIYRDSKRQILTHLLDHILVGSTKWLKSQFFYDAKKAILAAPTQAERNIIQANSHSEWKQIRAKRKAEKESVRLFRKMTPQWVQTHYFDALNLIRKEKQQMLRLYEREVDVDHFLSQSEAMRKLLKNHNIEQFSRDSEVFLEWLNLRMTIENDIEQYLSTKNPALLDIVNERFNEKSKLVSGEEDSPFYHITKNQMAVVQRLLKALTQPDANALQNLNELSPSPLIEVQKEAVGDQPEHGILKEREFFV
jgi:hypothetical protein